MKLYKTPLTKARRLILLRDMVTVPENDAGIKRPTNQTRKNKYVPNQFKAKGEVLYGIHPVRFALQAKQRQTFYSLSVKSSQSEKRSSVDGDGLMEEGATNTPVLEILKLAKEAGITVNTINPHAIEVLAKSRNHQGVCLDTSQLLPPTFSLDDNKFQQMWSQDSPPFWLFLHKIQDPMNLGAILRSASYLGVDRVLLPKDDSCPLSPVVSKASSGAMEVMDLMYLPRHPDTIYQLFAWWRKNGGLVIGTVCEKEAAIGVPVNKAAAVDAPTLLVMGNEGTGLPLSVLESCNILVTIPSYSEGPPVQSLNVSVATGIILSHLRSR